MTLPDDAFVADTNFIRGLKDADIVTEENVQRESDEQGVGPLHDELVDSVEAGESVRELEQELFVNDVLRKASRARCGIPKRKTDKARRRAEQGRFQDAWRIVEDECRSAGRDVKPFHMQRRSVEADARLLGVAESQRVPLVTNDRSLLAVCEDVDGVRCVDPFDN